MPGIEPGRKSAVGLKKGFCSSLPLVSQTHSTNESAVEQSPNVWKEPSTSTNKGNDRGDFKLMSISLTFFSKVFFGYMAQGDGFYDLNLIDTTAVKWKRGYWVLKYNFLNWKSKSLLTFVPVSWEVHTALKWTLIKWWTDWREATYKIGDRDQGQWQQFLCQHRKAH